MTFWESVLLRMRRRRLKYWSNKGQAASQLVVLAHKELHHAIDMCKYYSDKIADMVKHDGLPPK